MKVLATGGAGYIGSHTCVELLNAGHEVFVIDNLSNGHEAALERVRLITNCELQFMNADILASKASEKMCWKPEKNIKQICEDTWFWHELNPSGYGIE